MLDVNIVGIVELDVSATGAANLIIYSDLPGDAQTARETRAFDASGAGTRRVIRLKLAGTTKGRSFKFEITPAGSVVVRLYGARIYAKALGTASEWRWIALPVTPTPEEWSTVALSIDGTPDEWVSLPLAIEPTPEEFSAIALPIDPTPEQFREWLLPIEATPDIREWVQILVTP